MTYEVTIAIPVYNTSEYIEKSLVSALDQTFESIEFLVIDDKGTDNSMDIVCTLKEAHPRGKDIRIIDHINNKGTGATKNTAIRESRGKYLYFMDSDDYIEPNTIEILYNIANSTHAEVVMGSYRRVRDGKEIGTGVFPYLSIDSIENVISKWMRVTHLYYPVPTWNKLYLTEMLRNNKIYCIPHHRNEDSVFSFQIALFAKSIVSIPDITYNYSEVSSSTVHQSINDFYYKQYVEIFNERKKLMINNKDKWTPEIINYFVEPFFSYFIRGLLISNQSKQRKKEFLSKISSIYDMGLQSRHISGFRYKLVYHLLPYSYMFLKFFYLIDDKTMALYNISNSLLRFTKLPYNHL